LPQPRPDPAAAALPAETPAARELPAPAPQPGTGVAQHPMVLPGKDGWLFLNSDSNRVMEQITGTYPLAPDYAEKWAQLFDDRADLARRMGFRYFYGILPNKECVYARHLPDGVVLSEDRPVRTVLGMAAGRVQHRYYLDELTAASATEDVYLKGDTHWNHLGGLLAFNAMMRALGLPEITAEEFRREDTETEGDLSGKIGRMTANVVLRPVEPRFRLVDNNGVTNIGQRRIYEHPDKSLPRAVLFRDSFSSHQLDMFASRFSRIVCLWQPNIDPAILAEEAPDFVIGQQVERFLVQCPDDRNGPSHRDYEARKVAA
jgi:alginate O-acetyltransferase complex protein AlgJ